MSALPQRDVGDAVVAPVQFTTDVGQELIALVKKPGEGLDDRRGAMEWRDVTIQNARRAAKVPELDREGFSLTRYPTAVKDFYDDEEVRRVYYPEMEELVKRETGASRVIVFDHTIRVDNSQKMTEMKVRAPVDGVHNDFTIRSAEQRVKDLLPDEADALLQKRFGSINTWRPIVSPVETRPLAICEWGSIDHKDLVNAERHYPDGRIGGIYYLVHNPTQRWSYYPFMESEEVILLKCYDSLTDGTARWTAHGSFTDPNQPADPLPRESIEIRTLYFFD